MMKLFAFEERWAVAVLEGFAPKSSPGLAPRHGEVDYGFATRTMMRTLSLKAALGMRVGVWMVSLAPLWLLGTAVRFGNLAETRRAQVLERMLGHRAFVVRELTLFLKLTACMAIFGAPGLRERAHYDAVRSELPSYDDVQESGERLRLPLLASAHRASEDETAA